METEYLKRNLGTCLVEGLTEVAVHQPVDPINFLAHWIYRYKKTINEEDKVTWHFSFCLSVCQRWVKISLNITIIHLSLNMHWLCAFFFR